MEIFVAVLVGWLVLARRLRAGYFFAGGGAGIGSVS